MIDIYTTTERGMIAQTELESNCWINATNPTPAEIAQLVAMGIPEDYLTAALDLDERPRTERENGELLILLLTPKFQGHEADIPYTTTPLGIILTANYLITVCRQESDLLNRFATGQIRNLSTTKRNRFVLRILLSAATKYLEHLREINKKVDLLEDQLQLSTRNREVLELLKYQKSLTYFTTALKANELMMERLHRSRLFLQFPEDEDLLEDVLTETRQAIEMTNIASNILSSMMDAFASIISNNQNSIMKFLASVTIILSLPTMIASYFGMNVPVPLQGTIAFPTIMGISLAVVMGVILVFLRRDWL